MVPAACGGPRRVRWVDRFRLRALGWVVGIALCALATISLTTVPAWPVVGVAIAVAVVALNTVTARLNVPSCLVCGESVAEEPAGEHGVVCPSCGAVNDRPGAVAQLEAPNDDDHQHA